jgi:hypothetical protein
MSALSKLLTTPVFTALIVAAVISFCCSIVWVTSMMAWLSLLTCSGLLSIWSGAWIIRDVHTEAAELAGSIESAGDGYRAH